MAVPNLGLAAVLARLPGRRTRNDQPLNGGSFLHWVPDGRGSLRLAGHFVPGPDARGPGGGAARTHPRRGPRRAG